MGEICTKSGWVVALLLAGVLTAAGQSTRPGLGAIPYADAAGTGVTFRVWAPFATNMSVKGQFNNWSRKTMASEGTNGLWSVDVAGATAGQEYKFTVNRNTDRRDPRSRRVTSSVGNSIVYDTNAFDWAGVNHVYPALEDLVIYELHPGTFNAGATIPGTFDQCIERLDHVRDLGVNAVEVMPPFEFPYTDSWGYNPADLFAIESTMGGPDAFKRFVKACHQRGLAVFVDVVHNHYGPSELALWQWDRWNQNGLGGIYFYNSTAKATTPWGNTRPDFGRPEVRQYIRDQIFMLTDECRVDGFRWDSVFNILYYNSGANALPESRQMLNDINTELATTRTGVVRIAEDHGFDYAMNFQSQWESAFQVHLQWQVTQGSDSNRNMGWLADHIASGAGRQRVVYSASHDSTGDLNNNVRLPRAIDSANPTSIWARKRDLLAATVVMTTPGIPMLFQGQEMLEDKSFGSAVPLRWELTNTWSGIVSAYRDLVRARRNLLGATPGLLGTGVTVHHRDETNKVIGYIRWNQGGQTDDAVVVANFSVKTWTNQNYVLEFPSAGTWYSQFNSDATRYGADFGGVGSTVVVATGSPARAGIDLGRYAAQIFTKVPPVPPGLVAIDPPTPTGCVAVAVQYDASGGPLAGATSIVAAVGRNGWAASFDLLLTPPVTGTVWTGNVSIAPDTAQLDLAFHNGATSNRVWDNNLGADWHFPVVACASRPAAAMWLPATPQGCAPLVLRYEANNGPLQFATNVVWHVGRDNWQFVQDLNMTAVSAGVWVVTNDLPADLWQLDFAFHDGAASNRVWDNHGGLDWHVSVLPCPSAPGSSIVITNPVSDLAVASAQTTLPLQGLGGTGLVGHLVWSNALNGAWGQLPVTGTWSVAAVPLAEGVNIIGISGTNDAANPNAGARDAATNLTYTAPGVWTNGQSGGIRWGGGWALTTATNSGVFLANTNEANLRIGPRAWGLWANGGGFSAAARPFVAALQPGDVFSVQFQNNWIDNGASAGIGLQNSNGVNLLEFYFPGGGTNYVVNDATNSRPTGLPWTDQGLAIQFTLLAADLYELRAGSLVMTGQLAAAADQGIERFRVWNYTAGPGGNYNVYVNQLALDGPPLAAETFFDEVAVTRQPGPNSDTDGDGFLNWEEELAGTDPANAASHLPDIGAIAGQKVMQVQIDSTAAARWYDVFLSTNLAAGLWQRYGLEAQGSGNPLVLTITNGEGAVFYRIGVYQP